jgi:ubiquinone/menaquinone biosynthesis C-methylase UbiE
MDGVFTNDFAVASKGDAPELPDYLVKTYSWAYLTPTSLRMFDNRLVVNAILWGNFRRLVESACAEFSPGQHLLQAASVYGNLSKSLAEIVGSGGWLEVIDIALLQVEHCRQKLIDFPRTRVRVADAAQPGGGPYDAVCCFFLLHEVPDDHKRAVVDGLLRVVPPGGKAVFVDYHKPLALHPLRPIMDGVFRWLEPYARGLLDNQIWDLAGERESFTWRKETYFGGLYQKVVAERRLVPTPA